MFFTLKGIVDRRSCLRLALAPLIAVKAASRRIPAPTSAVDAGLQTLLDQLRDIAKHKDAKSLYRLQVPTFRVEFDHGKGPEAFRQYWHPESPSSPLWPVLMQAIALPPHLYSGTLAVVPYIFGRFPLDENLFTGVVATRERVPVYGAPEASSEKVDQLNWELVELTKPHCPPVVLSSTPMLEIQGRSGRPGYVASADVYSPAGHRLFFEKRAGKWLWISMVCANLNGGVKGERPIDCP